MSRAFYDIISSWKHGKAKCLGNEIWAMWYIMGEHWPNWIFDAVLLNI